MDPNATLDELREAIAQTQGSVYSQCYIDGDIEYIREVSNRIVERVEALDGWLSKGGFLPDAWCNGGPRL